MRAIRSFGSIFKLIQEQMWLGGESSSEIVEIRSGRTTTTRLALNEGTDVVEGPPAVLLELDPRLDPQVGRAVLRRPQVAGHQDRGAVQGHVRAPEPGRDGHPGHQGHQEQREQDREERDPVTGGALVGEGRKILDEGIAQRASDIDVVYVYGYGFPAWRGGPMHYGDVAGL